MTRSRNLIRRVTFVAILLLSIAAEAQVNYDYFLAVGRKELSKGNYRDAVNSLTTVIKVKQDEFEAYLLRGIAKYNLDDLIGAEQDFSRAITLHPLYSHAYHYRGVTRDRLQDYYKALSDLDKAIELDPFNAEVFIARGSVKLHMESYIWSVSDFDSAIRLNPQATMAYLNRGIAKSVLKDNEGALEDMNKAINLEPYNDGAYLRRGLIWYEMEEYEKALTDFNYAIKLERGNPYSYFNRALALYHLGDTAGAISDYSMVVALDPYNALSYYNRALLKAQTGQLKEALSDFERVLSINPRNIYTYFNRATVKHQLNDFRGAISDYSRAIELFPDFAGAYLNRSEAKRSIGDDKGAYLDYEKAYEIVENINVGILDSALVMKRFSDSTYFDKIIEFEADFMTYGSDDQAMAMDLSPEANFSIQYIHDDLVYIREQRKGYYFKRIAEVNEKNRYGLKFALTNSEIDISLEDAYSQIGFADSILSQEEGLLPQANFYKGIINSMVRNYNTAISEYNQALKGQGELMLVYFNRSNAYYEMAEHQYKEAYYSSRVTISWGEFREEKSQAMPHEPTYELAIEDLDRVIAIDPTFAFAYYNRANIKVRLKDYDGAIRDFTDAVRYKEDLAEAYYNRGLTYLLLEDREKACRDMSAAGELGLEKAYPIIKRYCK